MIFAIIGKLVVSAVLVGGAMIGGNAINSHFAERRAQRNYEIERTFAVLHEYDENDGHSGMGGVVARLPLPLPGGTIPEIIHWNGKTYQHDPYSGISRDWVEVPRETAAHEEARK